MTATLKFTVEAGSLDTATLVAQLKAAPIPTDLLTAMGVYVATDSTVTTTVGARNAAARTIVLNLVAPTPMSLSFAQDSSHRVTGGTIVAAGAGYGGQPRYDMSTFALAGVSPVGLNSPRANQFGVPKVAILMKVDAVIVGQPGSGYTTPPLVVFEGNTTEGGTQAQGTATVVAGALTHITVTNPGSGYCMAPRVVLTGGGGSGGQAMATLNADSIRIEANGQMPLDPTLFPAGPTEEAFPMVAGPDADSRIRLLSSLMQAALQAATRFPVISAPPIIT